MKFDAFKAAVVELYESKDLIKFIETILAAILGDIAADEGFEF